MRRPLTLALLLLPLLAGAASCRKSAGGGLNASFKEVVVGVPPGPLVGQVLARLLEKVLDDPDLNTRERLLSLLPETARSLSTGYPQA